MRAAHSHTPRLEKETVLAALRVEDIISTYGITGRQRHDELHVQLCFKCGPRSRADAVHINLVTGKWRCMVNSCAGDKLDMIALINALDTARDFKRVLEIAADIAGVGPGADPAALQRARDRIAAEAKAFEEARQHRQQLAIVKCRQIWKSLARRSLRGESYLQDQRGLDVAELLERDLVRFGQQGDPFVALWSSVGEVRNVVRRYIDPGVECPADTCGVRNLNAHVQMQCWKCRAELTHAAPASKVAGQADAPTAGTLVGKLSDLTTGRLVVITEGVIDTLTAALAWPHALVLGAHGASEMPNVAMVAKAVGRALGQLYIVGHNDPPSKDGKPGAGTRFADQAMKVAIEAGLVTLGAGGEPVTRVHAINVAPAKDLNEAWKAGWRP